ncbi:MAG: molecular chaperone HtpG [Deltaproteobacteria bacterium HGW-Deltaproteobacteria-14]|jgi:molecular chaperone HtpG|nr:MAG: molecular chaperone HtpG [Deltaproteobacteria bacterium HGW-Deltaproteobacteria-14]
MTTTTETHRFEAEVSQVLRLVINSLYSNKEIFLRELISNASDALDKLKYRGLTEHTLAKDALEIRIHADEEAGTLTIEDTGVGMTHDELVKNLGTVAHSGSKAFIEALAEGRGDVQLIGQFGVGFYSAYLVADKVEVLTRAAGSDEGWRWISDAGDSFTVEPAARAQHGTAVVLHLKEDQREFLSSWRVRQLVTRYSDYISYPIQVQVEKFDASPEGEEDAAPRVEFEQVNRAVALWQRPRAEITAEEYEEFYKHLTHDWDPPLAFSHFKVEGRQMFTGVLFVPKKPPFDLYSHDHQHGVRLHVKRVFIMDECKELLPPFLRFLRGVVDSDDLPLNVSRELLQDSATVRFIKKQLTKRVFDMLDELAKDRADDYRSFWQGYGAVMKEGLHTNPENKDRITPLLRYRSTTTGEEGLTSLAEYKERMPEGQKAIYYVIAESERAARTSPHLEAITKRGYEVLFMTDPIDEWAVQGLGGFDDVPLEDAMGATFELDDSETAKEEREAAETRVASLIERIKEVLGDRVEDVRVSDRLTSSPACLVVPEGGHHAHVERLFKATQPGYVGGKRIFEINGTHPLIEDLNRIHGAAPDSPQVAEWVEVLHTQALLSEGSRLDDPSRFVEQVTRLLSTAAHGVAGVAVEEPQSGDGASA